MPESGSTCQYWGWWCTHYLGGRSPVSGLVGSGIRIGGLRYQGWWAPASGLVGSGIREHLLSVDGKRRQLAKVEHIRLVVDGLMHGCREEAG